MPDDKIRVILVDTTTGNERPAQHKVSLWCWTDGNWSCDCNREIAFGAWTCDGACCGSKRYLVIAASAGEFDELNQDYPATLRDTWREKFRRIHAR